MKIRNFYLLMFTLSIFPSSYLAWQMGAFAGALLAHTLPIILGSMLGLMLLSTIAVGIVAGGYRLFKKRLPHDIHIGLFLIVWLTSAGNAIKMEENEKIYSKFLETAQVNSSKENPNEELSPRDIVDEIRKTKWDKLYALDNPYDKFGHIEEPEKLIEAVIGDCETTVRSLNAASETLDRVGDNASERIQIFFTAQLTKANNCAIDLTKWTGHKYTVSKDWFGSGYTLMVSRRRSSTHNDSAEIGNTFTFKPDGCEYSIEFPDQPKLTNGFVPVFGDFVGAQYVGRAGRSEYFVRANCMAIDQDIVEAFSDSKSLIDVLIPYASSNGLQNAEYKHGKNQYGVYATVRGFKIIDDTQFTFEAKVYVGTRSFMEFQTGGPSDSYPQSEISNYWKSIKMTKEPRKSAGWE